MPGQPCERDDLPALTGRWALICGESGGLATAVDVETGEAVALSTPSGTVGANDGVLYAPGMQGGRWTLPAAEVERFPYASPAVVSAPATDGAHLALAYADHVEAFTLGDNVRVHITAAPLPGEPLALIWPAVYWTERSQSGDTDVWTANAAGKAILFAGGAGDQRLVVSGETFVAWVDQGQIRSRDLVDQHESTLPSDTGFLSAPTVAGDRICWEDRGGWRTPGAPLDGPPQVVVRCSDGQELAGPTHQLHPALSGHWLAVREADGAVAVYELGPAQTR